MLLWCSLAGPVSRSARLLPIGLIQAWKLRVSVWTLPDCRPKGIPIEDPGPGVAGALAGLLGRCDRVL